MTKHWFKTKEAVQFGKCASCSKNRRTATYNGNVKDVCRPCARLALA